MLLYIKCPKFGAIHVGLVVHSGRVFGLSGKGGNLCVRNVMLL